jgi:hypothetical protein
MGAAKRLGRDRARDLGQVGHRFGHALELAGPETGAREELERDRPVGKLGGRDPPQVALGALGRRQSIAALQLELAADQRCEWMRLRSGEQLFGLLEASLAPAEVGQAHAPVLRRGAGDRVERLRGGVELRLCPGPIAAPEGTSA